MPVPKEIDLELRTAYPCGCRTEFDPESRNFDSSPCIQHASMEGWLTGVIRENFGPSSGDALAEFMVMSSLAGSGPALPRL